MIGINKNDRTVVCNSTYVNQQAVHFVSPNFPDFQGDLFVFV